MNRQTPKEIIEQGNAKTEQAYIKFPREKPLKVSNEEDEKERSVVSNLDRNKISKEFFHIHTHPYEGYEIAKALPSRDDLLTFYNLFIRNSKFKGGVITQRSYDSGEIQGYTVLLQGKKRLWDEDLHNIGKYNKEINKYKSVQKKGSPKKIYDELKDICDEYDWKLRFVPAKGYHFYKGTGNFEKNKGIEKIVASVIGGFIIAASLLNLTRINVFVINEQINVQSKYFVLIFVVLALSLGIFMIINGFRRNKK